MSALIPPGSDPKPAGLSSRLFVDGGDPKETRAIIDLLGFLDGQTTNPSLIAKNPEAKARLEAGGKFSRQEVLDFYRGIVRDLAEVLPRGSISIEVYADEQTTAEEMLAQGREMFSWIQNAHIKFPTTAAGLAAAQQAVAEGMRVNMTLVFSQAQAAAVHAATRGAERGQVYVSPFIGRLDDRGENGMDLIANIQRMYAAAGNSHVLLLTASVRSFDHFMYALKLGSNIITSPAGILKDWAAKGKPMPRADYAYPAGSLKPIAYQELDLGQPWTSFDIRHELTDKGQAKFAADWNSLIA